MEREPTWLTSRERAGRALAARLRAEKKLADERRQTALSVALSLAAFRAFRARMRSGQ